jgi:integrase
VLPKALPKRIRLTDLAVGRIGPGIWWDTLLPAFGIRVGARSRTWIVAVRRGQHPVKNKLGRFPAMRTKEARDAARALMGGTQSSATLAEEAKEFLERGRSKRGRPLRPATMTEYRRALMMYAADLHRKPVSTITRQQIAELIGNVARTRGTTTAQRVRGVLSAFWSWLIATGKADNHIVVGTPSFAIQPRSRVLTDPEIARIWQETEDTSDYALIVRLLFWTGARRAEVGGMRWSELVEGEWRLPGSRAKNGRALTLPLPSQAVAAIAAWPRIVGKDTLFGRTSAGFTTWTYSKRRLDKRLKFREPFDLHDIRRSTQTRLLGLGIAPHVVNRLLNHGVDAISATYDHYSYLAEKVAALQIWAADLERAVGTAPQKRVYPLVRKQKPDFG